MSSNNTVQSLATFGPLIGDAVPNYALISTGAREIGTLIPNVVIEEIHRDELQITQHPVETGTPVSDHAFMMPVTVEMRCGWSNSSAQSVGYVQAVYSALQQLQQSRTPFNITTGKRQYSNMLIRSLIVRTDPDSEYTLNVIALCQQVTIVGSATTSASNSDGTIDPASTLSGETTTPDQYSISTGVVNSGQQNLVGPIQAAGG
jgi:hypothetical protein